MILPSGKQRTWILLSLALAAAAGILYHWAGRVPGPIRGGSPAGIILGIAAAALVLLLAAFGARKRAYRSTLGTLEGWLQAHIYLGLLSALVALLHSGFHFADRVASATLVVLLAVVASGLLGARLYASLPRRLSRVESNRTAQEISDQLNQLTASMSRLADGRSAEFRRICDRLMVPFRPGRLAGWKIALVGSAGDSGESEGQLHRLLAEVEQAEHPSLRQLLMLARQHKELHLRLRQQQRYRNLLDMWLYLHLPLSIVLLVLLAAHILAVLYFGAV